MTVEELIQEGNRLARPCVYLTGGRESGELMGIWGGDGILDAPLGPYKHWITLDCSWFAKQGLKLKGLIAVYSNTAEEDSYPGVVVHDSSGRLPKKPPDIHALFGKKVKGLVTWSNRPDTLKGVALYGHEAGSFPPLDAVFKYGDNRVKDWLASLGLPNPNQWDPYFQARKEAEAYESEYQNRCPFI